MSLILKKHLKVYAGKKKIDGRRNVEAKNLTA